MRIEIKTGLTRGEEEEKRTEGELGIIVSVVLEKNPNKNQVTIC